MTQTEELTSRITDALIEHSIVGCPRCMATIESPDLGAEEAILKACKEAGLKFAPEEWSFDFQSHSNDEEYCDGVADTLVTINSQIEEIEI